MKYPYTVKDLPYAYNALEPFLDEATLHFHHDKHLQTYVNNLNKVLEPYPEYQKWELSDLLINLDKLPNEIKTGVRNNGGGVFNHIMYFESLTNKKSKIPSEISAAFGGEENLLASLKKAALGQFGSGFAWLVQDAKKQYKIIALPNQDNPLSMGLKPLLPLDVWEHAYYLGYQNKRDAYLDNLLKIIDWNQVSQRAK